MVSTVLSLELRTVQTLMVCSLPVFLELLT